MKCLWIQPDSSGPMSLTGVSSVDWFRPSPGEHRFHETARWLADSEWEFALAAFSFETHALGSVASPAKWTSTRTERPTIRPSGKVMDRGITEWRTAIRQAIKAIDHGDLLKVVVARRVVLSFAEPLNEILLAEGLAEQFPDSYVYAVDGFVGASPELLVSLKNGVLRTQTLAGTAVGANGLDTEKQRSEHQYAAHSVRDAIAGLTKDTPKEVSEIVRQGGLAHLATRFEAEVRPDVNIADCLQALHPTAAVAGTPTSQALAHIAATEPPRGRYAGPVGWLGANGDGVFAVGLRCGQIIGSTMTLFAGGGVVKGSEEEAELRETSLKLEPMLTVLGVTQS